MDSLVIWVMVGIVADIVGRYQASGSARRMSNFVVVDLGARGC
jgi:hypothetical protein